MESLNFENHSSFSELKYRAWGRGSLDKNCISQFRTLQKYHAFGFDHWELSHILVQTAQLNSPGKRRVWACWDRAD